MMQARRGQRHGVDEAAQRAVLRVLVALLAREVGQRHHAERLVHGVSHEQRAREALQPRCAQRARAVHVEARAHDKIQHVAARGPRPAAAPHARVHGSELAGGEGLAHGAAAAARKDHGGDCALQRAARKRRALPRSARGGRPDALERGKRRRQQQEAGHRARAAAANAVEQERADDARGDGCREAPGPCRRCG